MTCKDCRKIRYCMEQRGICTSLKEVRNVEQLKVIQIRKRKQTKEPVRQPDTYDKIVERAFWFVIGFSIALLVCCVAFGQTINA